VKAALLATLALTTPADKLDAALECPNGVGARPVLLVHGTSTNTAESWSWNYQRALPQACAVDLPDRALGDIQESAEYVVYAVRRLHAASGAKVDVIGHSQGPLEPRWAIKWWPDVRNAVDDLVSLSGPHHGAITIDALCAGPECLPAAWQMTSDSNFLAALNRDDETPGSVDVTSVISESDGLVIPPSTSELDGAANVVVQDLCPGREVDHWKILGDAATYAIVRDALDHPGGASLERVGTSVCAEDLMPGATYNDMFAGGFALARDGGPYAASYPRTREEPALREYAR
jgi:triacylglycerol esterase/lipase EstA (alpha/beta hydrolase family)